MSNIGCLRVVTILIVILSPKFEGMKDLEGYFSADEEILQKQES